MTYRWTVAGAVVALIGCGGGVDDTAIDAGMTADAGDGGSVAVDISAADGGEVVLGEARLVIPPGALAADTTVTAARRTAGDEPDSDTIIGLVYDFGPPGTELLLAARLTMPVAVTPLDDEEAVISWLDGGAWRDETSTIEGETIAAEVSRLATFAVRFRPAGGLSCGFTGCGGDLAATWDIAGACVDVETDNPFAGACPTATVSATMSASGTVTFGGDATYAFAVDLDGAITAELPSDCTSDAAMCEGLFGDEPGDFQCSGTPISGCTCVLTIQASNGEGGTHATAGSTLTLTPTGDVAVDHAFCVEGDALTLRVREAEHAGASFIYSATRQ